MPSGIYIRTKRCIENLRKSHIGIPNASKGIKRPETSGVKHWRWNGGSKRPEYTREYCKKYRHRTGFNKKFNCRTTGIKPKVILSGKEYSEFWKEIRVEIYKRDKWKCQECGVKCTTKNDKNTKRKISCHHIDYNEKNNSYENLITLCASCHGKTNFKRDDWIKYFKNKVRLNSHARHYGQKWKRSCSDP